MTHTENVFGIGNKGSNYEIKQFIHTELMPEKEDYYEKCIVAYEFVVILESPNIGRDLGELSWEQLTYDEQFSIARNISSWDKPMFKRFLKYYPYDATIEGGLEIYGP